MTSGFINQKIQIFSNTLDVSDGSGGSISNIQLYWTTSAEVEQVKASRNIEALQEKMKPVFTFKVRFRDDKALIADMQVIWRGQQFTIQSIEPDYIYKRYVRFSAIANLIPVQ